MNKKAQAAMEFLMTYGWAILVVLAAIAALAYFGVLSPDRFLPDKCTFPSGFSCNEFSIQANGEMVGTGTVTLFLTNGAGFDLITNQTYFNLTMDECGAMPHHVNNIVAKVDSKDGNDLNITSRWVNGKNLYVQFNCTKALTVGQKLNGQFVIEYQTPNGLIEKSIKGEIITKVAE